MSSCGFYGLCVRGFSVWLPLQKIFAKAVRLEYVSLLFYWFMVYILYDKVS